MAKRHEVQKKAKGGGVAPKHDPDKLEYTGKGSHLMKEAHEEKRGGKITKKATGGKVDKPETKAAGGKVTPRLDKRARGGGVHASGHDETSSPFSAAHVKPHMGAGGNPAPHHLKHKGEHGAKG